MKYFDTEIDVTDFCRIYVLADLSPKDELKVVFYNEKTGKEFDVLHWLSPEQQEHVLEQVKTRHEDMFPKPYKKDPMNLAKEWMENNE